MKNCKYIVLEQQFSTAQYIGEVLFSLLFHHIIIPICVRTVVSVYAIKEYAEVVGGLVPLILSYGTRWGEWLALLPGYFIL
jgi:hypothetical protein